jgi:hypothetical protein
MTKYIHALCANIDARFHQSPLLTAFAVVDISWEGFWRIHPIWLKWKSHSCRPFLWNTGWRRRVACQMGLLSIQSFCWEKRTQKRNSELLGRWNTKRMGLERIIFFFLTFLRVQWSLSHKYHQHLQRVVQPLSRTALLYSNWISSISTSSVCVLQWVDATGSPKYDHCFEAFSLV